MTRLSADEQRCPRPEILAEFNLRRQQCSSAQLVASPTDEVIIGKIDYI